MMIALSVLNDVLFSCALHIFVVFVLMFLVAFFFSSRRRHTRCALVTGLQTCALPILVRKSQLTRVAQFDGIFEPALPLAAERLRILAEFILQRLRDRKSVV